MTIENILSLLGGLALFLYGMHMMSDGLEEAAGDRMKTILEKLTSNRFLGIIVGALITAVVQSSSATTVMVVGFVNSKLMTLSQAVWIIMGANIGTTITGQLVALNVSEMAPLMAIVGVVMVTFIKNKKVNSFGEILAGLGILFIGMSTMSGAMGPLRNEPAFIDLMTTISNPFVAVLFGAGFTALIQSSSASVGILQTLAMGGLIPLSSSIYIIFGQNIGTCITSVIASLGASRNAKRATVIHLSFNLIGTALFMLFIQLVPFVTWMEAFTTNPAAQIANTHTIFNIATTLLLIPFGYKLAKIPEMVLPVLPEEKEESSIQLQFIDKNNIGNVPLAMQNLRLEAQAMLNLAKDNLIEALGGVYGKEFDYEKIDKREDHINLINFEVAKYMSQVSLLHMSKKESAIVNALYKSFADIERIGDHALNIAQYQEKSKENGLKVQISIVEELRELKELLKESFALLLNMTEETLASNCDRIEEIEEAIDNLTASYREKQIERMRENKLDAKDCVIFSQIMTDIERVSDHMMNIMEEYRGVHIILTHELFD
ncbi:MAG: Na/Pi cotransporter family protein [Erysipelotrichaceae bacterium]|nr:Na/Pi cotransporter family protein [Erysipelotrichaceae bacterium]